MLTPDQKAALYSNPDFLQSAGVVPKSPDKLSSTVDDSQIKAQFDSLRSSLPKVQSISTPITQTPETYKKEPGILNKIGLSLISSEKGLGESIGTAAASRTKDYQAALESKSGASDMANRLALQIQKMEKSGKDTTRARQQYKTITGTDLGAGLQDTQDFSATGILGEAAGKSGKQIAGEALGTVVDIVGAGSASKGVKAIKTVGEGVKAGAKAGAVYGTVSGIAEGMQQDKDLKGIAGEAMKGGLTGAAGGAVAGAITGKIAQRAAEKEAKLAQAFAPKLTVKEREGAIKSSRWITDPETGEKVLSSRVSTSGAGPLKSTKYATGSAEQEMARRFGKDLEAGKGKIENVVANINESANTSKKLVDTIAKENPGKIRNTKQIVSDINKEAEKIKQNLLIGKDASRQSAWDAGFQTLQQSLKNAPKTREGLVGVFRDFNKIAANIKAYEGTDNITKQAVIAIRDSLRKEILKGLPKEAAAKMDDALLNQHWAIQAIDRLSKTSAGNVGKSSTAKKVTKEVAGDILKYGVGTGAIGYGIGKLTK